MPDDIALSPAELAKALHIDRGHIDAAIAAGLLTAHQIGVASRILVTDAEAWVRSLPTTPRKRKD